ncbi:MAG: HIT family protein [Crocinitomicaceae bacterium]|nr:HIT family protein [Crocinitomicaceae bacterium]
MASIFTKIINGEIPSYKVHENDDFLAFLDINPLQKGHTLIVPKKEVDYFFDQDNDTIQEMILFSKEVARKIKDSFPCNRVGMTVIGLEVPHAHIHLIPINAEKDMNFRSPKLDLTQAEFIEIAEKLQKA